MRGPQRHALASPGPALSAKPEEAVPTGRARRERLDGHREAAKDTGDFFLYFLLHDHVLDDGEQGEVPMYEEQVSDARDLPKEAGLTVIQVRPVTTAVP